jgi:hypothetical protein
MQSHRAMAGNALYATLFEPPLARLDLYDLPTSHRDGPVYLNVQKILDTPATVAMVAENTRVVLYQADAAGWEWPRDTVARLNWDPKQLQFRPAP